ncbi:MAG: hypothetical protein EXS36_05840 [Pedosphaera sp.]|nr:hypothetical protein [Pedosphaera sp.]
MRCGGGKSVLASSGLYHWSSILGGRACGWVTAWLNLAGLVTVLGAINGGAYDFAVAAFGLTPPEAHAVGVVGGTTGVMLAVWFGWECRRFAGPPRILESR